MEHIEIDDLRLTYRRAGAGPPVVLLHGGISDSREWKHQLEHLCDRFSLYAWDAPGSGGSDDPDEHTFRLPDYADALAGFLHELSVERAAIVGLSFGSGLALQFYQRHPHLTSAVVLASPYAGWAGSLSAAEVQRRLDQADRESQLPAADFIPGWIPGLLTETRGTLIDEVISIMSDFHPSGYRMMARSFAEADLRPVLPTINVPLLVLSAELDLRSPPAVGEELAARSPTGEFVVLEGASHMSNLEAPAAFNRVLADFLMAHLDTPETA